MSKKSIEYKHGSKIGKCVYLNDEDAIIEPSGHRRRMAMFLCKCGKTFVANLSHVKSGNTNSCGCHQKERVSKTKTKHGYGQSGKNRTSEYNTYYCIIQRCKDKKNTSYGAIGIDVCDRWKESFLNFIEDMGDKPSPDLSIERIDNSKGYCKENCKWGTLQEQSFNKRNTRYVEYNGITKPLKAWVDELGFKYRPIHKRIFARGWPVERAFSTPLETSQ
jgi:hypothetical protein